MPNRIGVVLLGLIGYTHFANWRAQEVAADDRTVSGTERVLIEIWQAVLQVPAIRVNDEFVDLGGDSLSAMMCISRVRKVFPYDIPLIDFFTDDATIAHFAAAIDAQIAENK